MKFGDLNNIFWLWQYQLGVLFRLALRRKIKGYAIKKYLLAIVFAVFFAVRVALFLMPASRGGVQRRYRHL